MIMGSTGSTSRSREANHLSFDVQASLDNNLNMLAVSGQETSVADKDEKTIQVLGKADSFGVHYSNKALFKSTQEAISPKPTVCTVHPGQYLPCGIGPRLGTPAPYELTWSDIRRWELGASAIVEIFKSSGPYNLTKTEKIDRLGSFLEEHGFEEAFDESVPNFPAKMLDTLFDHLDENDTALRDTGALFLYLLRFFIPLTAAYGGIHLSAWKFEFPSRIESMIWRTACFIIMGSPFALLAVPSWARIWKASLDSVLEALIEGVSFGFFGLLFLCYAAARLYLVVESFISLRHVPIGVYAAVPWVQNIPHV